MVVGLKEIVLSNVADNLPVALSHQVSFFAHLHVEMAGGVDVEHDVGNVVTVVFRSVAANPCGCECVVVGGGEYELWHLCGLGFLGKAAGKCKLPVHPCSISIVCVGLQAIGVDGVVAR